MSRGEHEQARRGSPRKPPGHGFIAPTRRKRAGNVLAPATRATETTPSSSGSRNASRASLRNSGSSSRKRTPKCASESGRRKRERASAPLLEPADHVEEHVDRALARFRAAGAPG